MQPVFDFDAACALSKGQRCCQEDAIIADFARGAEVGLAVLADGMGGHAAGDVASKIVVTEVFSELMFHRGDPEELEQGITVTLRDAAMAANACLREHMRTHPDTRGMGATLVATVIVGRNLYWISIGDSPLFLFRDGILRQLNEDHSMAPQIDFMVKTGLLGAEEAKGHPDRNTLTSVLFGKAIPRIDCPQEPLELQDGDVIIVASDGLQFLPDDQIEALLRQQSGQASAEIADSLMACLLRLEDPDLDNISFSLIKVQDAMVQWCEAADRSQEAGLRRVG